MPFLRKIRLQSQHFISTEGGNIVQLKDKAINVVLVWNTQLHALLNEMNTNNDDVAPIIVDDNNDDWKDDAKDDVEIEVDKSLNQIVPLALDHMIDYINTTDTLSPHEKDIWRNRIKSYQALSRHRHQNVETQKKFESDIDNIADDELVFVFNYKQNLIVCHCPEETHWKYRHLSQRTCFGVIVYSKTHCYKLILHLII